ncbi:MAG: hypothetical protein ACQGVK_20520 [Myxococcota bacterium]
MPRPAPVLLAALLAAAFACAGPGVAPEASEAPQEAAAPSDADVLLDHFLGVRDPRHRYTSSDGIGKWDELAAYQEWSAVYARLLDDPAALDERGLRRVLWLARVARDRRDAALSEALSRSLVPLTRARTAEVLDALAELPFLVEPVCHFWGRHFGFEGENEAGAEAFEASLAPDLEKRLGASQAAACADARAAARRNRR